MRSTYGSSGHGHPGGIRRTRYGQTPHEGPSPGDDEPWLGHRNRTLRRVWQGCGCSWTSNLGGIYRRRVTRHRHHVHARRNGCSPSRLRGVFGLHIPSHGLSSWLCDGVGLVDRTSCRRRGRGDRGGVDPCCYVANSSCLAAYPHLPGRPHRNQPAGSRQIRRVRVLVCPA